MYDDPKTPEAVSDDIRARLATKRRELDDACRRRPLTITAPADCPADLAKRIADHNAAAVGFLERRAAHDEAVASLPRAITDPAADPADMPNAAGKLRVDGYVLCREHIRVLEAREPLLKDAADVLTRQVAEAEGALAKVHDRALAALKTSGWSPLAARGGKGGQHPDIEARQFEGEVKNAVPVKEAQATLDGLRRALGEAETLGRAIDADIVAVGQDLIGTWRLLVGPLV